MGKLPQTAAVNIHLEKMVERIFGKFFFIHLVLDTSHVRIVLAPRKHNLLGIVGKVRAQEIPRGPVSGQTL